MEKIRRRVKKRLMALLAAACILGNMPSNALTVNAQETVSGNELAEEQIEDGQENELEDNSDTETDGDEEETADSEDSDNAETDHGKEESGSEEDLAENDTENAGVSDSEAADMEQPAEDTETETEREEEAEDAVSMISLEEEISTVSEQQVDSTYTDSSGVVYHYYGYDDGTANIYELESYKEPYSRAKSLNIPEQIGDYTVTRLTFGMTDSYIFPTVTIPETVTYIGGAVFKFATIKQLFYNAESAVTEKTGSSGGSFVRAEIQELHIGENVKVIPDALFAGATITEENLTLNVEKIGQYAFYQYTTVTNLTIGENVKVIGDSAFGYDTITNVFFNAIACSTDCLSTVTSPFSFSSIEHFSFGNRVTMIPDYLLNGITYSADELVIPASVTSIGEYAFYGTKIQFGKVTLAENIASIGTEAFGRCSIEALYYNAVNAEISGRDSSMQHRNPFESTKVGELHIGDHVEVLNDGMFYVLRLDQESLIMPDSLTHIGKHVLSCDNDNNGRGEISIGTLEISENVEYIGRAAFGRCQVDRAVVRAVHTGNDLVVSYFEEPICGSVEIHGNADSYSFFTDRTEADNITLLCEDFETAEGAEYFDESTSSFVIPVTNTCTVCGYEEISEERQSGYTVTFTDYDGRELSRQHVHSGADAAAPPQPKRTGYEFTGWDHSYTNVTSDLTIRAQYKILTFHVEFKDGERMVSDQLIEYGSSASLPEDPTRPVEEWGTWKFIGWQGNYENIVKDEVIQAQFEKVMNRYEVIFYDADGEELDRQTVTHGEAAKTPEPPKKKATAQYSYVFTGWSGDTDHITGEAEFYPEYRALVRSYTVKFMDGSKELSRQIIGYGGNASLPEDPARPAEEWGTWKFIGWQGIYENIVKDEVIQAQFERVMNRYEVIFYDADGEELDRQTVIHGEAAKTPEAPQKEMTPQYNYTFTGWDGDTDCITGDIKFYPVYAETVRVYTVTFINGEQIVDRQTVEYGGKAVAPDDPVMEPDDRYSYTFAGWEGDYSCIKEDTIVRALFDRHEIPKPSVQKTEPNNGDSGTSPEDDTPSGQDENLGEQPEPPEKQDDSGEKDDITVSEEPAIQAADRSVEWIKPAPVSAGVSDRTVPAAEEETSEPVSKGKKQSVSKNQAEDDQAKDLRTEETGHDRQNPIWLHAFMLLSGLTAAAAFLIWLYLVWRNRKVSGIILNEDGTLMCGAQVTMIGKDMPETETDEDGYFCMECLKKDDYRLKVFHEEGYLILSMDIYMESKDKDRTFFILESYCNNVETRKRNRRYKINITA